MRLTKTGLCLGVLALASALPARASSGAPAPRTEAAWGQPRFAAWQDTDPD